MIIPCPPRQISVQRQNATIKKTSASTPLSPPHTKASTRKGTSFGINPTPTSHEIGVHPELSHAENQEEANTRRMPPCPIRSSNGLPRTRLGRSPRARRRRRPAAEHRSEESATAAGRAGGPVDRHKANGSGEHTREAETFGILRRTLHGGRPVAHRCRNWLHASRLAMREEREAGRGSRSTATEPRPYFQTRNTTRYN